MLAEAADLDLDEALVTIWDSGYEAVEDIDDFVPARDLAAVQRILGLSTAKQMQSVSYWQELWGLDRAATEARLRDDFQVLISPRARTLPKGSLKRLRRTGEVPLPEARPSREAAPKAPAPPEPPALVWEPPGHEREVVPLSVEEICQIHGALARDFLASGDPIDPPGVRDENLLHSAAARPETSLGHVLKYPTVETYAAALMHSLVHNHPFFNGNKRTALVSMLVLLDRNNMLLTCSEKELFRYVLRVAQHRLVPTGWPDRADREVLLIAKWICEQSRAIQRGERRLKWKELRRILTHLGCDVGDPLPGNKIKIQRDVEERVLGFKRRKPLTVTAGYRGGSHEVDSTMLSYIRRELRLDDAHGYDSGYFYGSDPREPDEFIGQYRTLLRRLGKL